MNFKYFASHTLNALRLGIGSLALLQLSLGATMASAADSHDRSADTRTPIKHVVVIIGENRSFDHVFATYEPKNGEKVWNLLSEGIVNGNGSPGPNFYKAEQQAAADPAADSFLLSPAKSSFPNGVLPAPLVGGPKDSYVTGDSLTLAQQSENGLPAEYYQYLVSGGTGQASKTPDARITNVNALPPGPFQLTNGKSFDYNAYSASPVHRFYQMWQQLDCSVAHATPERPSAATRTCSRGSRSPSARERTASSRRRTSALNTRRRPSPRAKGPLRWASTTCRTAMFPTSRAWPTTTP